MRNETNLFLKNVRSGLDIMLMSLRVGLAFGNSEDVKAVGVKSGVITEGGSGNTGPHILAL